MKKTNKQIMQEFGLPEDMVKIGARSLRYRKPIEKGIAWFWCSKYIRLRDVIKYGTCVSCGREITMKTADAGHFIPAKVCGNALLMDEHNVHAVCRWCNRYAEKHIFDFEKGLRERYGDEYVENLKARYGEVLKSRKTYWRDLAKYYKSKYEDLWQKYYGS